MKTIGLLGGMTWLSTLEYYRIINSAIVRELGGFHSAKCLIYSFDFDDIKKTHQEENWETATRLMIEGGQRLKSAGADFIVICTNSMHLMADEVQEAVGLPVLHIVDAVAAAITKKNINEVGLLGTKITMEQDFYIGRMQEKHGITALVPEENEREAIQHIIDEELSNGRFTVRSKSVFKNIIDRLEKKGAGGIILGCTEIPLLLKQDDYDIPLIDTLNIHAEAAVRFALCQQLQDEDLSMIQENIS